MSDSRFRPNRRMNLFQRLRYHVLRATFTGKHRRPFYETLRFLLDNGKAEAEAFRMIGDVHTNFGQRWHPYNELAQDCLQALGDNRPGHQLLDVLALWIPQEEAALLGAGLKSGSLSVALTQSDRLIDARGRILQQVIFASVYPLLFIAIFSAMLLVNNLAIIPKLSKISDPAGWTGALRIMNTLAGFTDNWATALFVAISLMLALVVWSLPRWRGRVREAFDGTIPWSLYKDLQGAVFLMNVAALLESGLADIDVLLTLRRTASPWLQERIDGALDGISLGNSLGMALRNSGFNFPDRQTVNFLSLLDKGKGAAGLISRYAERALENIIARVKRRANVSRGLSMLLILLFFVLIGALALQIQDMSRLTMH